MSSYQLLEGWVGNRWEGSGILVVTETFLILTVVLDAHVIKLHRIKYTLIHTHECILMKWEIQTRPLGCIKAKKLVVIRHCNFTRCYRWGEGG